MTIEEETASTEVHAMPITISLARVKLFFDSLTTAEADIEADRPRLMVADLGWSREKAARVRSRLASFEEDWDAPGWMSTMPYKRGEVVLADFPFADLAEYKKRSALVVQSEDVETEFDQQLLAQITSKLSVLDPAVCESISSPLQASRWGYFPIPSW